jgi:hypothetical protein
MTNLAALSTAPIIPTVHHTTVTANLGVYRATCLCGWFGADQSTASPAGVEARAHEAAS